MSIIIKPIVTEKVTKESEVLNRLDSLLTEKQIKFRLRKLLKLLMELLLSVNTMNVRPDRTTKYTKSGLISGKTNAIKKAIVQEGETIDFTTISKIENVSKKIKTYYPRSAI
jgi:large subunit ribosomal protein L23